MSTKTMKFALAALVAAGVGIAVAQETGDSANASATTVVAQVEEAGESDEGPEIVVEALKAEVEIAKEKASQPQQESKFVSAEQQVQDTIEKKMKLEFGYLSERKSIIAQGYEHITE